MASMARTLSRKNSIARRISEVDARILAARDLLEAGRGEDALDILRAQYRQAPLPTGETIMAGLNCGTVSSLAWPYLRGGLDAAVTVSDADAAAATAELGSGPCGAACVPAVRAALPELGLDRDATVVLLGTEARYRR